MNTQELIYKVEYYENGKVSSEKYYLNGKFYRENGPAYIEYFENGKVSYEQYCLNDKLHRENGPAYIAYHENGKVYYEGHYLNGIYFTKENWEKEIKKTIQVNNYQTKLLEEVKVINGRLVEIQKLLKT
jgi:antitoxin component YwqK of YwqJK toxin-antitoxin module